MKNGRKGALKANAENNFRYSVRKLRIGVVSVAIAAFFLAGRGTILADEIVPDTSSPPEELVFSEGMSTDTETETDDLKPVEGIDLSTGLADGKLDVAANTENLSVSALESDTADEADTTIPDTNAKNTETDGEWTNLTEVPINKTEAETQATISNPTVSDTLKLSNNTTVDITKYKVNPDENQYTFAIVALDNLATNSRTTFNGKFQKDWYLTFSLSRDRSSFNVQVNLVDAATNTILETKELSPNTADDLIFDKIREIVGNGDAGYLYPFSYSEATNSNGAVTRNIRSSVFKSEAQVTYVLVAEEPTIQGITVNSINLIVPDSVKQNNYYKVVDYDRYQTYLAGNASYYSQRTDKEDDLSVYVQEGIAGQTFHVSGVAEYDKYELVETPEQNGISEGVLFPRLIPDTLVRTGSVRYVKRLKRTVNENGDAKIEFWILDPAKVNVKEYDVNQEKGDEQIQTDKYLKVFETPVLKPGEWNSIDYNQSWNDWAQQAGLTFRDNGAVRVISAFGSNRVTNGALLFPALFNGNIQFSQSNWFRLQNDNAPHFIDAYYYYVEKGSVIVHYEDTKGNVIKAERIKIDHGVTASPFNTAEADFKPEQIIFNGDVYYLTTQEVKTENLPGETVENNKLVKYISSETGAIEAATDLHLTYVYEKAGAVTVEYFAVDSQGTVLGTLSGTTTGINKAKVLSSEALLSGAQAGTGYDSTILKAETIQDEQGRIWRLVTKSNPHPVTDGDLEIGVVASDQTKTINYYYELVYGNVIIHYINEAGETIAEDVEDTPESPTGTAYDTTDHKPVVIEKNGKRYILVPVKTIGNETGQVVEGTTEITYVYKEVTEPLRTPQPDPDPQPKPEPKSQPKQEALSISPQSTNQDEKVLTLSKYSGTEKELPQTGDSSAVGAFLLGSSSLFTAVGLLPRRRKK
ncbi:MucBP domain-containing protein [Streptococcus sp. H49]|uniref:MucBP domain-containing protein n=1 Tax=Streptococcus huangxiaojuni TaxID=3237239 RepID=UPI0034A23BBD